MLIKKTLFSLFLLIGMICFLALPVFAEEEAGTAPKQEAAPAEPQAAQPTAPAAPEAAPAAEEKAEPAMPSYKASTIKAVQEALKTDGSYSGEVNGKLDDATIEAIKKFQEKKGLKADGIPGPKTREALGIGAAPAPKEEAAPAPAAEEKKEEGKAESTETAPESK